MSQDAIPGPCVDPPLQAQRWSPDKTSLHSLSLVMLGRLLRKHGLHHPYRPVHAVHIASR